MSKPVRSECPTCHEVFSSVTAFDFHRVGPYAPGVSRRCLTALEMHAEGMKRDEHGWWDAGPGQTESSQPGRSGSAIRPGQ